MKKILKFLLIPLLSFFVTGCHDFLFQELGSKKKDKNENETYELRPLDKLFINGFGMSLEQIYIMSQEHTDNYVDYCFKNGNETVNLLNYQTTDYNNTFLMYGLTKRMIWKISEMYKDPYNLEVEHGYGSNYFISEINDSIFYNYIYVKSDITFLTQYKIGDLYTYRGPDNHTLKIQTVDANGNTSLTNLVLEIIKEFDGTYLWLQTNNQYNITYSLTAPLTGSQVANEIAKGNYTLYLWNGLTTYKIGDNLYIPRFNSYVYVGTVNSQGMINGYTKLYYTLKFKIL